MTTRQKLVQLLNVKLNADIRKLESEIPYNVFHRIEKTCQTSNVYLKKGSDSSVIQLLATTDHEKENVSKLFISIHILFEDINENEIKEKINNNIYEKVFATDNKVTISLTRENNTFSITY